MRVVLSFWITRYKQLHNTLNTLKQEGFVACHPSTPLCQPWMSWAEESRPQKRQSKNHQDTPEYFHWAMTPE